MKTKKAPSKKRTAAGRKPRRLPPVAGSQFWVIDTDTPGISQGTFTAYGPFYSQAQAETHIIEDTKSVWEDSCTCLTSDKSKKWQKPSHIVQVIRTVEPEITANVVLVDTANT